MISSGTDRYSNRVAAVVSSVLWVLGFSLSVLVAPQLRIWTWGVPMLFLSASAVFALPAIIGKQTRSGDILITASGLFLVLWLSVRAAISPVRELAEADLLLVSMAVATFVSFRAISYSMAAQRILLAGIGFITVASLYVVGRQIMETAYSPVFPASNSPWPAGFFGHYSYGASFFIAVSFLLAGVSLQRGTAPIFRFTSGLIAILAFVAIYYTKSRGAFIGTACGLLTLVTALLVIGKRESRKWFAPAIIALPFLLVGIAILTFSIGGKIFEQRGGSGIETLDNTIRLYFLGIAVSCISLHPLFGGGARSFSWECFQFWDVNSMGRGLRRPEHVHNELVQTATDYGLIGAGLLLLFLLVGMVVACLRLLSRNSDQTNGFRDAWRIGGLAGFAGLFVQSNFEGIFRIPPGAILLALCISAFCLRSGSAQSASVVRSRWGSRLIIAPTCLFAIGSIVLLTLFGIKGTRATVLLWPTSFSKTEPSNESQITAFSNALEIWPMHSLFQSRAFVYNREAGNAESADERENLLELALKDFRKATELHPFDPTAMLGSATILSELERDTEAEQIFILAIKAQGGMEAGFKARYFFAKHLQRKGLAQYRKTEFSGANDSFAIAARHIDSAFEKGGLTGEADYYRLRVRIHENYGRVLEELGDFGLALDQYDQASAMRYGNSAHYRAAILMGRLAVEAWEERRGSDALKLFLDARHRIGVSRALPENVTPEKRNEWIAYLDRSIGYLRAAKYKPSEEVEF